MLDVGVLTVAFKAERFYKQNIDQFIGVLPHFIVCAKTSWHGKLKDDTTITKILSYGYGAVNTIVGDYTSDAAQRNAGLRYMGRNGFDWAIIVDTDEFWEREKINILLQDIKKYSAYVDAISAPNMHVYWKTWEDRIWPDPQPDNPIVAIKTNKEFTWSRLSEGTQRAQTEADFHHLSYVRTDEEVREKMIISEHSHEFVKNWYEEVWKNKNRTHDLHPVVPSQFAYTEKRPIPEELQELF